jgi:hypothetical protein
VTVYLSDIESVAGASTKNSAEALAELDIIAYLSRNVESFPPFIFEDSYYRHRRRFGRGESASIFRGGRKIDEERKPIPALNILSRRNDELSICSAEDI